MSGYLLATQLVQLYKDLDNYHANDPMIVEIHKEINSVIIDLQACLIPVFSENNTTIVRIGDDYESSTEEEDSGSESD